MKKKQLLTVLTLCIVLVGLCGGYFLINQYQSKKEKAESQEEEETVLYSLKEDEITKLHYVNEKADITLVKEQDEWKLQDDKSFPVEQSVIENMVQTAASVSATRMITKDCEDLSEYALEKPVLQIELTDKDGNQQQIAYGMESAAAEGCYAYAGDKKKIYVVPSNATTEFDYSKSELMQLPELPEINAEYVTSYQVESKGKTTFCAVYDKENAKYKDIYGWDITSPYSQTVAGDTDGLQNAFSGITALSFSEGVSYKADKKELKQYGLSSPAYTVKVKYYTVDSDDEEDTAETETEVDEKDKKYHTLTLLIGAQDDTQENYYVQMEKDAGIYLLPSETVESIAKIDAFQCAYRVPCPADTETLQQISLKYQNKNYTMLLSKKAEKDGDETEYAYTAKINGKKVDDEKFRTAYEALGEIEYSSEIKKNVKNNTPAAVLRFTNDGKKSTVKFLPYDGVNFYRVDVDGVCQFLAEKNTVDYALENLISVK